MPSKMEGEPHLRMDTLDAETPSPFNHCPPGHPGNPAGLFRIDAYPGFHRDSGYHQHCRGPGATSEYPDARGRGNTDSDGKTHCCASHGDASQFSDP